MADGWQTNWTPPAIPGQSAPPVPTASDGSSWSWPDLTTTDTAPSSDAGPFRTEATLQDYQQFFSGVGSFFENLFGNLGATDEDKLAQMILEKWGVSTDATTLRTNPNARAAVAYARMAAHRANTDSNYRQQLATSMGWNQANPHVASWIQQGTNLPTDPMGTGLTATGQPTAKASTTAAASAAMPFDPSAWKGRATDPGYTYGAVLPPAIAAAAGVPNQWGVDYALPQGTQLNAPFAGKIIEADTNGPYGQTVVIQMQNGYTYRVAHLEAMNVGVGQQVGPGSLLGLVGNTGNSYGAHVLIEMRDSTGKPIDPTPIISDLLNGDFTGANKTLGDYVSAASNVTGPFLTSDGHLVYPGTQDYDVFFAAQQFWRKRYGGDPPWSFVSSLIAQGATTSDQIQSVMDQMPSDFPNMNWGQRTALVTDANNAALKAWDRPLPDATIKDLAAQGINTPGQIQGWIASHPASQIDPNDFKTIYDQTNPQTQELWQQPPSPALVKHIHDLMTQGPA